MELELLNHFMQFGVAGFVGALWWLERRHSAQRERELSEAHERLMRQRVELHELIAVLRENTVSLTSVEESQDRLVDACERIAMELGRLELAEEVGSI
ncbi:MAG: hypothetical protein ACF8PN_08455 [Phycisphaerales bacterium]